MIKFGASFSFNINDSMVNAANDAGLEAVGMTGVAEIKKNITAMRIVDTGRERASVTWKTNKSSGEVSDGKVQDQDIITAPIEDATVLIGTACEYAETNEWGYKNRPARPAFRYSFETMQALLVKAFWSAWTSTIWGSQK